MRSRMARVLTLGVLAATAGCSDFGRPDDLVPRERLRVIDEARLAEFQVTDPSRVPTTLPATMPATQPAHAPEMRLSIQEARRLALENNLNLRVTLLDPTISREEINQEQARFESTFLAGVSHIDPDGSGDRQTADLGVLVPLRTGGDVRVSVPLSRNEGSFPDSDTGYVSGLDVSISQPLLRGAGFYYNSLGIRIAHYSHQLTEAGTKLEVIRFLAGVDRLYWQLYAERRALEVSRTEYEAASRQLDRSRRRMQAGTGVQLDVTSAEASVAAAATAIISRSTRVRTIQRDLKRLMNAPGLDVGSDTILVPSTPPVPIFYELDREQLVRSALQHRMELLEMELRLSIDSLNVSRARNELLPALSLDYDYSASAFGRSAWRVYSDPDEDAESHRLSANLSVPIGNEAAKSRLRQALAQRQQDLIRREDRVQLIKFEVLNQADDVESNWQLILSTRARVAAEARTVEAELRRYEQGINTSIDVLDAQARLANAQIQEIAAVADYQINQVDIAFATGTLLGASKVVWEPAPQPRR